MVPDVHEHAVWGVAQHADHAFHELHVGDAEAAEAQVHERPGVVARKRGHPEGLAVPPHAAVEVDEALRVEGVAATEAQRLRVEQQVQVGGRQEELGKRQRLVTARREELVETGVDGPDHLGEALAVALEAGPVVLAAPGEVRRDVGVRDLVLAARDHADPGAADALGVGVERDVVVDDEVRGDVPQEISKPVPHRPARGLDERLPAGLHVGRDLLVGRAAEARQVPLHEAGPVLRRFVGRHGRHAGDVALLEAVRRRHVAKARVEHEHALEAPLPQPLAQPHEVHDGPDGPGLRKDGDPAGATHEAIVRGGAAALSSAACPRPGQPCARRRSSAPRRPSASRPWARFVERRTAAPETPEAAPPREPTQPVSIGSERDTVAASCEARVVSSA
jgi:hypothetical protein